MSEPNQLLDDLVQRMHAKSQAPALLGVSAPLHGVRWRGAVGPFARGEDRAAAADDGFRIASMSKTFTATLLMMEVETGRLHLTDRLDRFFPKDLVNRVHPDASSITLHHLLNHTAGLWDFALSRAWFEELSRDPGRFRPPQETLGWAIANGRPAGPVGGKHVYSDTGYVLLGRVLEIVTGQPYHTLCRERLFAPLGMHNTWLEGHEAAASTLTHCYFDDTDALVINGSADWAAGGHVSTLDDLHRFLTGLLRDNALVAPETLERMLVPVATPNHHYGLGVGIRREKTTTGPAGYRTFWGHSGHWGSFMFYVPSLRATVCGTVNLAGQDNRWIFEAVLDVLEARVPEGPETA
ncbi:MAG: serine hydrolase domain-containing protein [Pseudomonadales bacterium]